jgi:hypothetical protein
MVVKKVIESWFFYFFIKIHFLDHDMFYLKNNVSNKKLFFSKQSIYIHGQRKGILIKENMFFSLIQIIVSFYSKKKTYSQ